MKKKNTGKGGKAVAIGAGVLALGAVAYLLLGPDGKKNQKKVKSWMVKMKAEVAEKLEALQEVTEPVYAKVVDGVTKVYNTAQNINKSELTAYAKNLKKEWKNIAKMAKTKKPVKKSKTAARKKK